MQPFVRVSLFIARSPTRRLRRCKRLLPHQWTMELDPSMAAARNGIQHMVDVDLDGLSRCSNCGVQAIGLRLCGRCKSKDAKYCR